MIKVTLEGVGAIDNAVIFLEDPGEKMPYFLKRKSSLKWERDKISIPIDGDLNYSLYVLAFSGTSYKCTITNTTNSKTISFQGVTGTVIKSQGNEVGSKPFE